MSPDITTRSGLSAGSTGEMSRPNNLQRIAQKKAQVRNYPRTKKLEKLAVYSSCKVNTQTFKFYVSICLKQMLPHSCLNILHLTFANATTHAY